MSDLDFLMAQTLVCSLGAVISFITGYLVFNKDRSFVLNRIFTLSIGFFGLFSFMVGFSNIPILFWNGDVDIFSIRASYTFLILALLFLLLSALIIEYGPGIIYRKELIGILAVTIALNLGIIWLTDSVLHTDILGDIVTSTLFKIVVFGTSIISFVLMYYFYFKTFRASEGHVRERMRLFLVGLTFGALALIGGVLSDFIRVLDLIDFLLIVIMGLFFYLGFRRSE
ncbi:MAG: hypothetical protein ACFFD4_26125 [Candidatus Odinarchaeota archaeon]